MIKSLKLHTDQTNFQSLTKVAVMSMKPFFHCFWMKSIVILDYFILFQFKNDTCNKNHLTEKLNKCKNVHRGRF